MKVTNLKPQSVPEEIANRKPHHFFKQITVIGRYKRTYQGHPDVIREIATLRFYQASARGPVSCCFWTHVTPETAGFAKASGTGYCKSDVASIRAIENAGYSFDEPLRESGNAELTVVLTAIAVHAGFTSIKLINALQLN